MAAQVDLFLDRRPASAECQVCGHPRGCKKHRCYVCPAFHGHRQTLGLQRLVHAGSTATDPRWRLFYIRGLMASPISYTPSPIVQQE
eukprot:7315510-Pyramimonas_sp.AAC.1